MPGHQCFDLKSTCERLAKELSVRPAQVRRTAELLEDGNTLPFIARYRKEATGGLDDGVLRKLEDGLHAAKEIADRKSVILNTIRQQGSLTDPLHRQIEACHDKRDLEGLYRPFKPKRRTRAGAARERGLEPLADVLLSCRRLPAPTEQFLSRFVNQEKDVPDVKTAIAGACDIVAERWADDPETRAYVTAQMRRGDFVSSVRRGQKKATQFTELFNARESVRRIPSHRFLAAKRGETEGVLRLRIESDTDRLIENLTHRLIPDRRLAFCDELQVTVKDCFARLLQPAAESTVLQELKERADREAVEVFAANLRQLLLAPPAGPRVTIGIDPGFRSGCKLAVVDPTGMLLAHTTIYPTPPRNETAASAAELRRLVEEHVVRLIAIGNGTASRETSAFVHEALADANEDITTAIVSESGASVYSASELAAQEYPDLDVTVRGAISIAHRLQDPLAELVKLDPRSIGVGQYQHDVNQALLQKTLVREVESCVNSVGVDVNLASPSLLRYVAGIGPKLAERIVTYRNQNGRFENRLRLKAVRGLGARAFRQAAGFLRIFDGDQPLDQSAVHPESYYVVERIAEALGEPTGKLIGPQSSAVALDPGDFVDEKTGLPTVTDIISELSKPGRDPRETFRAVRFREDVTRPEDLQPGMKLEGIVTNVTRFGAFVDIGVHQDGLIHVSELANRFVRDPAEVVSVGDILTVEVVSVDMERDRIALSRKRVVVAS